MLIYEKNNKLNINFDNEISENPDLQIGKEDGKTQVLVDGQESGGGSELFVVQFITEVGVGFFSDVTYDNIYEAYQNKKKIIGILDDAISYSRLFARPNRFHFEFIKVLANNNLCLTKIDFKSTEIAYTETMYALSVN
jgi:hypothetical protein